MTNSQTSSVFTTSGLNKRFKGDTGEAGLQGDAGDDGVNAYGPLAINTVNTVLAAYTLQASDEELTLVLANSAVANTVTIPPFSSVPFAIGAQIFIAATGVGQTTIVAGSGVTINSASGLVLSGQYSGMSGVQTAQDEWLIFGDLTT